MCTHAYVCTCTRVCICIYIYIYIGTLAEVPRRGPASRPPVTVPTHKRSAPSVTSTSSTGTKLRWCVHTAQGEVRVGVEAQLRLVAADVGGPGATSAGRYKLQPVRVGTPTLPRTRVGLRSKPHSASSPPMWVAPRQPRPGATGGAAAQGSKEALACPQMLNACPPRRTRACRLQPHPQSRNHPAVH